MSRNKVLTIIIIAIVALLAAFGIWYYLSLSNGGLGGSAKNGGLGGVSFPSGSGTVSSSTTTTGGSNVSGVDADPVPRLRQIANVPVAGGGFQNRTFQLSTTSTSTVNGKVVSKTTKVSFVKTFISYIQRADGHVFETAPDTLFTGRLSITTIPKIYHADFVSGNSIVLRYLNDDNETVESFIATLFKKPQATSSATSTNQATTSAEIIASEVDSYELGGNFLPSQMGAYTLSADRNNIFYLMPTSTGVNGITRTFGIPKATTIFLNPLKQWIPDWSSKNTLFMTTSPSVNSSGYLYLLNQSNGQLSKLLGPKTGFSTLGNAAGTKVLYSAVDTNGLSLYVYSLTDKASTGLNIKTLPEKCVWSKQNTDLLYCSVPNSLPEGSYPDSWNQGTISFTDSLWSINTLTGQTQILVNPAATAKTAIDGVNLILDSKENTLMFTNKIDMTLWDYRLIESSAFTTSTSSKQ